MTMMIVLKKTLKITKTMTMIRMITMMTMMMIQDIWSEHSRRTQEDPESLMREEMPSPNPSVLSLEDWVDPAPTNRCHSRHMLRSANTFYHVFNVGISLYQNDDKFSHPPSLPYSPATDSALSILLRELKARSLSSLTNIEAWMDVFTREFTKLMVIGMMQIDDKDDDLERVDAGQFLLHQDCNY